MANLKMPQINYVVLAGNLTYDPVLRNTPNGNKLVTFTIAVNKRYRDSNDQRQEDVYFVDVVTRSKLAESCNEWLKKGDAVVIEGELQSRKWKVGEDVSHQIVEVKARKIQFLSKTERNSEPELVSERSGDGEDKKELKDNAVSDKNIE